MLLVGYAVIRFGTEFLRADNKLYAFGMTFSQVVSVYILLGCVAIAGVRALLRMQTLASEPKVAQPAPLLVD